MYNPELTDISSIDDKRYWLILETYGMLGGKYHEYAAAGKEIHNIATCGFNIPESELPQIEHWYCMLGSAGVIDTLVDNEIKESGDITHTSLVIAELFQYITSESESNSICNYENLYKAMQKLSEGEKVLLFDCGIPLFKHYFSANTKLLAETYYIFGCRLNLPEAVSASDIINFRKLEAVALTNFFIHTIQNLDESKCIDKISDFATYLYNLIAWGNTLDSFLDFDEDVVSTYYQLRMRTNLEQKKVKQQLLEYILKYAPKLLINTNTVKTLQAVTSKRAKHMFSYMFTGGNSY